MSSRRGMGCLYRPTYQDKRTGEKKQSRVWWIAYRRRGKRIYESTRCRKQGDARKVLQARLAESGVGPSQKDLEKVMLDELLADVEADYVANHRRSVDRLRRSNGHLRAFFDGWRAIDVTAATIQRYKAERLIANAANATVNRELAALRRALRLGKKYGKVGVVPDIEELEEDNIRTGFFEESELLAILGELPRHHRPWAEAAYITGWRARSELLTRQWRHVDLGAGWLRLEPGETKNRKGRQFPLIPRLRAIIEAQWEQRRELGFVTPWVFCHPNGKPIRYYDSAWQAARRRAGLPHRIVHDFRRTAARNLVRSGVPETVAMKLTGHLTRSVFERYAITDEAMLEEQAAKLTRFYGTQERERKVIPLANG